MYDLEKRLTDSAVLRWSLANRDCRITEVSSWVIMALLEDIIYCDCNLIEQLVLLIDKSHGDAIEGGELEKAAQKLITNVLLASLYEDGFIEISRDALDVPAFFEFHEDLDILVYLTPSGEDAQVWEELALFESAHQASIH